ncbi:MAG: tetratricopeptide repeat protein [Alphaproteobacteria bacterium]|nr:MAG: tetratricopeptide repeat protein [Alphaproteobacteria bacterium]
MICRPDKARSLIATAVLAPILAGALALGGCADNTQDQDPLDQARTALSHGDGLGAEIILRRELDAGTPRQKLAALLGEAELVQGHLADAREWLSKGEFDKATWTHGFHMLGRLEMRDGNLPAAGAAFDKALTAKPDDSELWVDIARLRYQGGEQVQAIEAANQAVKLGPENPQALHFRGLLVRDAFGLEAAIGWFEAGLRHAPDNPALLADYAATLGELGRAKEMLKSVRRLAAIDPDNLQIFYLQAVLAARAGKPEFARALLQRSGDLERERPAAMLLSAVIDMQNGNNASAAQVLTKLARRQPENRRVQALLAHALSLARNESELIYTLSEVARRPSASPYLQTLMARAFEARGDREAAAWYLDQSTRPRRTKLVAIQGDGTDSILLSNGELGGAEVLAAVRGAIIAGEPQDASRIAEEFAGRFAGSADALSLAGDARLAAGDAQGALQRYRVSASVRRSWPLTRRMITAYRMLGQTRQSETLLADYVRSAPNNLEAIAVLAEFLAKEGRANEARILAEYAAKKLATHSTTQ